MIPQYLTMEGIYESEINFDFSSNDFFHIEDAEKIRTGIICALFDDDSVKQGKVGFSFISRNNKYVIERNLDEGKISLTINDDAPVTSEILVDKALLEILGVGKEKFVKYMEPEKGIFQNLIKDRDKFISDIMEKFSIKEKELKEKQSFLEKESENLAIYLNYLDAYRKEDLVPENKILLLREEIEKLKSRFSENEKNINAANQAEKDLALKEGLKENLASLKSNSDDINSYKDILEKCKDAEGKLLPARKNVSVKNENENIMAKIAQTSKTYEELENEIEADGIILSELSEQVLSYNEKISAEHNKFISYSSENLDLKDPLSPFNKELSSYYTETDKEIELLKEKKDEFLIELEDLLGEIGDVASKLFEEKYPHNRKKALRDGMVIETKLAEKEMFTAELNNAVIRYKERISDLDNIISYNENVIENAKAKVESEIGREVLFETLYNEFNEKEKERQELYRNQIMASTLMREIKSIDDKIYENEVAQRSFIEDLRALENAKKTLVGYMARIDEKLASLEEKLVVAVSQKKYYDTIASTSYGDNCPVCNSQVLDKNDFSTESARADKAFQEISLEKNKAQEVKKDYNAQLDKINLRLGELSSRVNTSSVYLESLIQTKESKIDLSKKIFEQSGVKNIADLTALLDAAIKKVAMCANEIAEVKNADAIRELASRAIMDAKSEIRKIEEVFIPHINVVLEKSKQDMASLRLSLEKLMPELNERSAMSQSKDIDRSEEIEDTLNAKLDSLYNKKAQLSEKILEIEADILSKSYRENIKVSKNGETLSYSELISSLIKDKYEKYFTDLKTAEDERQDILSKCEILKTDMDAKIQKMSAAEKELAALNAQKDANEEYIKFLTELTGTENGIEELEKTIIDAEQKRELELKIANFEDSRKNLECHIKALEEKLNENKESFFDIVALNDKQQMLSNELKEKNRILEEILSHNRLNSFILSNVDKLSSKKTKIQDKLEIGKMFLEKNLELLIGKAGAILLDITSGNYCLKTGGDGVILFNNTENTSVANSDSGLLALADISIECALFEIIKEFSYFETLRILKLEENQFDEEESECLPKAAKEHGIIIIQDK